MRALLTDEEILIEETIARITKDGRVRARKYLAGDRPEEPTATLRSDWLGLGIAEESGGSGGSLVAAALLVQELGRSLEPTAFVPEFVARHVISASGAAPQVLGERVAAVDLAAPIAVRSGCAVGVLNAVPGAHEGCVVVCNAGDSEVIVVEAAKCEPVEGVDQLRASARVTVDGIPLARGPDLRRARAVGTTLVAAELCGAGRGAIALAVDYANQRVQFGRPIGSYQAIAHRLADALAGIEAAWSLVLYACSTIEMDSDDLERAAHAAKASAGEAALAAADACVQTHGGMGITSEADPHLYLRRALFDEAWFGPSPAHRRALGRHLVSTA
jgi:alkylation response protein AidB-like acyl-CoA dehydrogenase